MSERDKFMARLSDAREAGLKDIKFFFMPSEPIEPEGIFAAFNEVEAAVRLGDCVRHTSWKGNEAAEIVEVTT